MSHALDPEVRRERKRIADAAYYAANRERVKARVAARAKANPEKMIAGRADHYARNRARVLREQAEYRAANPEVVKARQRKYAERDRARGSIYRAENKERIAAANAAWAIANREHRAAYRAARRDHTRALALVWARANPELSRAKCARRRALRRGAAVSDLTGPQWAVIADTFGRRCVYCRRATELTQDHVVPLSKGGNHTASNVVPACRSCNSKKQAGPPMVAIQPMLGV